MALSALDTIIVNYNSTDHLLGCLESLSRQQSVIRPKIYVQDNASCDDVLRVRERFSDVRLAVNRHNIGFGRAVNQAIRKSAGEYIIILNPDTIVEAGFLDQVVRFMQNHPDVGVMGTRILDSDGSLQNSARAFPSSLTAFFGRSSLLTRWFPRNSITSRNLLTLQSDGRNPMDVDWVAGAAMVVRRKAVQQTGLLDERFFMYWEDADWCRRMWQHGWRVVYYPVPTVVHAVGGSSDHNVAKSVFEFHRSVYLLFTKYCSPVQHFFHPLVLAGLIVRAAFVYASHGVQHCLRPIARSSKALAPSTAPLTSVAPRPIRILRVIARLNIGGPAIHVFLLTAGLNPKQFVSMLVAGRISPQEGDMGYLFDQLDNKPVFIPELQREVSLGMDLKAFWRIFKLIRRFKPDIVDTHTAKAGSSARLAVLLVNLMQLRKCIKTVHTFHGHVFEGYFSAARSRIFIVIERLMAYFTDVIIALSESQRQDLSSRFKIAPVRKIKIVKLGFGLEPFLHCHQLKGQFRQRLGIGDDVRLIGIVGRLVPIKNHIMFLQAADIFLKRYPAQAVRFVIVGDGELRSVLEAQTRQMGLQNHVSFSGWVRHAPMVYADLNVLAMTSINEGTPVSIIESLAASVPVIATDAGGVQDLLGRVAYPVPGRQFSICERGVLCPRHNPSALADGLAYLLDPNIKANHDRQQKGRDFVVQRYTSRRLIEEMETLYANLSGNNNKKR